MDKLLKAIRERDKALKELLAACIEEGREIERQNNIKVIQAELRKALG